MPTCFAQRTGYSSQDRDVCVVACLPVDAPIEVEEHLTIVLAEVELLQGTAELVEQSVVVVAVFGTMDAMLMGEERICH